MVSRIIIAGNFHDVWIPFSSDCRIAANDLHLSCDVRSVQARPFFQPVQESGSPGHYKCVERGIRPSRNWRTKCAHVYSPEAIHIAVHDIAGEILAQEDP